MEYLCEHLDETASVDTLQLEEFLREQRAAEINRLNYLSKKVDYLHTDLLYYRNIKSKMGAACYEVWKTIVKKVGGSPNCWRDVGHLLGVTQDDLNYIMNSLKDDPVDMVLKVFRQNEKATINKIVDAFIKLQRYDILLAIENPLCTMAEYFNKDDSGYQSDGKITGKKEIVTLKNLPNDLPAALNKNIVLQNNDPKRPKETLQPPVSKQEPAEKESPILFLTYAQDGLPTALNIQEYVSNWTEIPNVKVITLNNRREETYQNPEKFIREYFEKADYIVPIITTGYINEITSNNKNIPNTTENLDHKYVNFIYNLIVNNYIHATGCLNRKVRSVLPQNANVDLFSRMTMYPDLLPWTYETNFDEQFQEFLRKEP
ncbi:uncharacterized protein LOC101741884 isoform X2 [Bombyx mori]|uniref:Death domain-containing protein n=1 Tax=Bombyx mori TaxID=7091 RepID=A0A8R2LVS0_BOMMO|nr:uncharacterized protein LOC101741884 isoform X1 [Bombyx mori]XP_037868325.1 uncharacterized protein LOC101741884 isoform X2 [Bombyx mori]